MSSASPPDEPSPPSPSDTELEPDMASAMGFTSFGSSEASRAAKKRTHNNAFVDPASMPPGRLPRGADVSSNAGVVRGANATALGARRAYATADGLGAGGGGGAAGNNLLLGDHGAEGLVQDQDGTGARRSRVAGVASGAAGMADGQEERGARIELEGKRAVDLTARELEALRNGVRNERGDVAYYLPSFVEDPWRTIAATGPFKRD